MKEIKQKAIFSGGKRIARKGNAGNAIKWDQQQKKKDMECVHYESNKNGKRERERNGIDRKSIYPN